MKFDIITVGDGVVDAFMETELSETKGKICMPADSKIKAEDMWFSVGGCGVNTVVGFSKLGLTTGFLGNLGKDENAELILAKLKEEKVSFLGKRVKEKTGYSFIVDSKKKNRTILTYKGAALTLKWRDFEIGKLKTDWFYLAVREGRTLKTQVKLAKWAKKKGIKVACNPSGNIIKNHKRKLKKILKYTDVFILNKEEAEAFVGKKDAFKRIHKFGVKIVCITNGDKGSKVSDGNKVYNRKARKVKIVEKTGAGDAFASGFVFGIIKEFDIDKAMKIGSLNAEGVIKKRGASNGLLSWGEVRGKLGKDREKASKVKGGRKRK
ncbi:MAG: carbohydrate kinase family protein [archaeon]